MNDDLRPSLAATNEILYEADAETLAMARSVSKLFEIMAGTEDNEARFRRLVFACENWDSVNPQHWQPPVSSFIRYCHVRHDTSTSEPVLVFDYLAQVDKWGDATVRAFFLGREPEGSEIAYMVSDQRMRIETVPERLLSTPQAGWEEKIAQIARNSPPPTWQ